ncbi:HEAT repeat-containing protein 4 [Apteryx rowi]|uniref:HEAT repeat-containing protein 4 n=1 Tax=Apteryx rowi TaxID=308060 RepID=UPI000E1D3FEC|nr:HEAT repeat-containing protein 4 [Apteryx rowi]
MKTSAFHSNRRSVAEDPSALAECLHVNRGPAVVLQNTNITMPLQDFSHSEKHQLYYLKKYLRQIVEGLSFSKDVLEQRGLSYKEYNFKHLYDPSDIIQKPKSEKPIAMNFKSLVRLHPQKQPLFPMKNNGLSPKLRKEDSLWGSKLEILPRKLFLPPVPSCKTSGVQASLEKPCEKLSGSLTRGRQEKQVSEKNIPGSENMTWGVEKTGLEKLNRMTPQWTVDQQRARSGSVQCNPLDSEKQKFSWNTIRDELSSDRDLKILDNIQGRENDMEIISQTQAEKTPGTVLPISCRYRGDILFRSVCSVAVPHYYCLCLGIPWCIICISAWRDMEAGLPAYYPRVLSADHPADANITADDTERMCLNPESSVQKHLIARVGKYTYTPKNAFEWELYFVQRPKKGALRWIALPTLTPYFVQNDEELPPTKTKEVQKESKGSNKEVPWEIQVLRAMLEQWKDAWNLRESPVAKYDNRRFNGSLTSVHDISRIKAIIACASAAAEQHGQKTNPQKLSERSSCLQAADLHVGKKHGADMLLSYSDISSAAVTDSAGKSSVTQDVLAELQPLLRETLQDKNAHVRMASALCHYAIGKRNEEAQSIMKDALANGNSADSWAAAQCQALESTITVPVVTKLLSRLFEKSNAAAEEQACLLLAHLALGALPADSPAEQPPLDSSGPGLPGSPRCRRAPQPVGQSLLLINAAAFPSYHLVYDLMNKLSQMMWKDWNIRVRQVATLALGHMKLAKEIHDQLRVKQTTRNCQTKVQALSLIRQLQYMTAKLFPGFLQCFSSDFVAVRKEACLTAGALGIKDERVLRCLYEMMQYDPHWIIKVFAIRALGQLGRVSPELKHLLLWAVHYEEEPEVQREACCCIARLCLQDENVQATLLERLILEPNETVREEVEKAVKILHFPHEEDQEMIKEIKREIFRLSQKDSVTQKLLKLKKVTDWLQQKANRICWSREDLDSECEDILERITAVFQSTPGNSNIKV